MTNGIQRMTTLRILWNEDNDRQWIHDFSRSLATRVSSQSEVAEARVTVHIGQAPPPGPPIARPAQRREVYAIWASVACPVCGLEMPVNPNWSRIVSHYPAKDEHRYYGNPTYFCRGSNEQVAEGVLA